MKDKKAAHLRFNAYKARDRRAKKMFTTLGCFPFFTDDDIKTRGVWPVFRQKMAYLNLKKKSQKNGL